MKGLLNATPGPRRRAARVDVHLLQNHAQDCTHGCAPGWKRAGERTRAGVSEPVERARVPEHALSKQSMSVRNGARDANDWGRHLPYPGIAIPNGKHGAGVAHRLEGGVRQLPHTEHEALTGRSEPESGRRRHQDRRIAGSAFRRHGKPATQRGGLHLAVRIVTGGRTPGRGSRIGTSSKIKGVATEPDPRLRGGAVRTMMEREQWVNPCRWLRGQGPQNQDTRMGTEIGKAPEKPWTTFANTEDEA